MYVKYPTSFVNMRTTKSPLSYLQGQSLKQDGCTHNAPTEGRTQKSVVANVYPAQNACHGDKNK